MPDSDPKPPKDVVLVYSRTDDGQGACVLRAREGRVETGEVRAMKEGTPIQGAEVVKLHARAENPLLFDVDVQYDARQASSHQGPARVTSRAFRANYDTIFKTDDDADEGHALN